MGKTLTREQYKQSKFSTREDNRKRKESQRYTKLNEEEPKKTIKKKWIPHSEIDI